MLPYYIKKVKSFVASNRSDLYVACIIVFVSAASFGLGRLSVLWPKKQPIQIEQVREQKQELGSIIQSSAAVSPRQEKGKYVASKNGTSYHYAWCPGALKIKAGNTLWFQTKEEAENSGYKPAGNCPGL